jgi:hypothetical protein
VVERQLIGSSFRGGASYRGADAKEEFAKALDLPMSVTSTFGDQLVGGTIKSMGLGTAVQDFTVPEGNPTGSGRPQALVDGEPPVVPEEEEQTTYEAVTSAARKIVQSPILQTYDLAKRGVQSFINDPDSRPMSEEEYKRSPYYRDRIPWDPSMTVDRAAALAANADAKTVREFYAEKRPIISFFGDFVGQMADPINYIPMVGPAMRAAAIYRMGKVAGSAATASLDAVLNTAVFSLATRDKRRSYGDDVSWQAMGMEIATAALIGGAFGTAGGAWGKYRDAKRARATERAGTSMRTTMEAIVALNEGIDGVSRGGDVSLSPNGVEAVRRAAGEVSTAPRELSEVGVTMRERLKTAGRAADEAEASARIIDDAYTTFAKRANMTVKELTDLIGLPEVRGVDAPATKAGGVADRAVLKLGDDALAAPRIADGVDAAPTRSPMVAPRIADFSPGGTKREAGTRGAKIVFDVRADGVAFIKKVEKSKQGAGWDRKAMKDFLEQADKDNVEVGMTPDLPQDGPARAQALDAYKALGFVENVDGLATDPTLIRKPTPPVKQKTLFQSAGIRRGEENLKKYGLQPGKKYKTREVAAALEARQRRKYGTIERGDYSSKASNRISRWMMEEVMFEVEQAKLNPEKSAVGWYSTKFQNALDALGAAFPEFVGNMDEALPGVTALKTQQNARDFFTAIMAITSDGAKVADNFRFASAAYEHFRVTGRLDDAITFGGERNKSMKVNLRNIQNVLDVQGPDGMRAFLLEKDTVSNLRKKARDQDEEFNVAYKADMEMPYSAIVFGPKLGAFYANLMGDTGYLTMDRWWSRTFNRYRGTLLQSPTDVGIARFKELVAADRKLNTPVSMITDDEAIAFTVDYMKSYKLKGFKNGTEIEKAANTLYKAAFEGLEDQPFNASDREFMIDTTVKAQKKLRKQGVELTVADIQAVLWYYEKRLYGELGARQTKDISYEEIAREVAEARRNPAGRSLDEVDGEDVDAGTLDIGAAKESGKREVATDSPDEDFVKRYEQSTPARPHVVKGPGGDIPVDADGLLEVRHYSKKRLDEIDPAYRGTGNLVGDERARLGPRPKEGELGDPNVVDRTYFGTGERPSSKDIDALFAARRAANKLPVKKYTSGKGWDYPRHTAEREAYRKYVHTRGYLPEGGLGDLEHVARVDPEGMYNVAQDPLNIRAKLNKQLAQPERDTQFEKLVKDAGFKGLYYPETDLGQIAVMFEKVKPTRVNQYPYGLPPEDVVTPEEFDSLTPETFEKGGWGVVTATQEGIGPASDPRNVAANNKLRKELKDRGMKFKEVKGLYEGVDQGPSFLVFAPERDIADLGDKYKQESILTRKGLEYGDGRLVPVNPDETTVGAAAAKKDFHSVLPDGTAFSIGLDFDRMHTPDAGATYRQNVEAKQTKLRAFLNWFKQSKVVDANGAPLVVYTGTSKDVDFKKFKTGQRGAWFTTDPAEASMYATDNDSMKIVHDNDSRDPWAMKRVNTASRVFPVYLSIQNPYHLTGAELKAFNEQRGSYAAHQRDFFNKKRNEGYDGIQWGDNIWVAFEPNQIKSVNNSGAFSPKNPDILHQSGGARGAIEFDSAGKSVISLFEEADASTVVHESGHYFLNMLRVLAERPEAPQALKDDWKLVREWWASNADAIAAEIGDATPDQVLAYIETGTAGDRKLDAAIDTALHEQWARGFESYLRDGIAPTENLRGVFQQFKEWLIKIYEHATDLNVKMTPEIKGVFDRMLGSEKEGKTIDTSPPRPEPIPEGRADAEADAPKPDSYKAMATQYRVDPDTGSFVEETDIAQLAQEGRLTEDDISTLVEGKNTYDDGAAYGEALKAAVGCLI